MTIEKYQSSDIDEISTLFVQTVHNVCAKDYTSEQLFAWASNDVDKQKWNEQFLKNHTLVAKENGQIVGFGDITCDGYLDRLYVHKDFLRKHIATKLCDELESYCKAQGVLTIQTHASLTARSFFNSRNYVIEKMQTVQRNGQKLNNFVMTKTFE